MKRVQSDWAICLVITLGTLNAEQVRSVNRQLEEPWEQLIGSGSDHQMQMTVCVYNRYPVPAELLRIALRRTATIFEHAGIRVRWLNCLAAGPQGTTDPVCLPSPRSNTIVLTILGHAGGRYRDSL